MRAAELSADPARARYATLVERGEDWSDAQIYYYETVGMSVTCVHLDLVERAMRAAGVEVRLVKDTDVSARCCIDFEALKRLFNLYSSVSYAEFYLGNPDEHERPAAFLVCGAHNCTIHTRHSDDGAPLFPPSER